jgi:hypothetical protein
VEQELAEAKDAGVIKRLRQKLMELSAIQKLPEQ